MREGKERVFGSASNNMEIFREGGGDGVNLLGGFL